MSKLTPGLADSTRAVEEWISGFCQRQRTGLLVAFSVLYFFGAGVVASSRALWFDEIFTFELARLGFRDIPTALAAGLDVTPPLYNWVNHGFVLAFGATKLAVRLPGMIGCWVMAMCLFRFAARRLSVLYALIAMLCPFWLSVRVYAFEARPYGLMLGLSAAALLLWQSAAAEGRRRKRVVAALAVCMAAGSAIDFYFVLLLAPLAIGEAVRAVQGRRADWPVWLALLASVFLLPLHARIIAEALTYSEDLWSRPMWRQIPDYFVSELGSLLVPGVAVLGCVLWYSMVGFQSRREPPGMVLREFYAWESGALLGFLLVPVVAVAGAMLVTGIFVYRYAIVVALGVGLLVAWGAARLDRAVPLAGAVLLLLFGGYFGLFQLSRGVHRPVAATLPPMLDEARRTGLPVVMAEPVHYLGAIYQALPEVTTGLYYLADAGQANRYTGSASADRGLVLLQERRELNVRRYSEFLRAHREFWVYTRPVLVGETNVQWVLAALADERWQVSLRRQVGGEGLYHVGAVER